MGTDGPVAAYGCGVPLSENNDILSVTNSVIQRNLASSCPTEYPVVTRVGGGEEGAHDGARFRVMQRDESGALFGRCKARGEEDVVDPLESPLRSDESLALRGGRNHVRDDC